MQTPILNVTWNVEELGQHIQNWRKLRMFSQQDLAVRAHVSRQSVAKIEKGHPGARLDDVFALLYVLGQDRNVLDALNPQHDDVARMHWNLTEKQRVR